MRLTSEYGKIAWDDADGSRQTTTAPQPAAHLARRSAEKADPPWVTGCPDCDAVAESSDTELAELKAHHGPTWAAFVDQLRSEASPEERRLWALCPRCRLVTGAIGDLSRRAPPDPYSAAERAAIQGEGS